MHSPAWPQLAGGECCHSKAPFCSFIPAGAAGQRSSGSPTSPQGWLRQSQSRVWVLVTLRGCHRHTPPSSCSRGAALKTLRCSNQHRIKIFSLGGWGALLVLPSKAWTRFSLPHFSLPRFFSKGVRAQQPSHTHRADRKGVTAEEHCF